MGGESSAARPGVWGLLYQRPVGVASGGDVLGAGEIGVEAVESGTGARASGVEPDSRAEDKGSEGEDPAAKMTGKQPPVLAFGGGDAHLASVLDRHTSLPAFMPLPMSAHSQVQYSR